jgi:Mrp family chromosome partitioning ATPase
MLEALKVLDTRQRRELEVAAPPAAPQSASLSEPPAASAVVPLESGGGTARFAPVRAAKPPVASAALEPCTLPLAEDVADHYREMAARIRMQTAGNYCNVLLFVCADRAVEPSFSMTHLAQAFEIELAGDVLLVDGDLRLGRLSKQVARPGPGLVEAMLGQAQWTDIIHPTHAARIDFVASGNAPVPTVERPNFGWGALRPLYRAVLIGLAGQGEPETMWLAGRADAVYFVLSRPHTRRSTATAAVHALRATGANVAGSIVVND